MVDSPAGMNQSIHNCTVKQRYWAVEVMRGAMQTTNGELHSTHTHTRAHAHTGDSLPLVRDHWIRSGLELPHRCSGVKLVNLMPGGGCVVVKIILESGSYRNNSVISSIFSTIILIAFSAFVRCVTNQVNSSAILHCFTFLFDLISMRT